MRTLPNLWPLPIVVSTFILSCQPNGGGFKVDNASTPQNNEVIEVRPPIVDVWGGADGADYWAQNPGASVQFVPDSQTVFEKYVSVVNRPLNAPKNFRLYVDLSAVQQNRWGGEVRIGYHDTGSLHIGRFSTENPLGYQENKISYRDWYKGLNNAEFNQWFRFNNQTVFHGLFQDSFGAVVLVIDGGLDLGDGGGLSQLNGSIWFKNFERATSSQFNFATQQGEMCWFILIGPYQCGTFKDSSGRVNTTSALYPKASDGYQRLGTFSGLNANRAFKQ